MSIDGQRDGGQVVITTGGGLGGRRSLTGEISGDTLRLLVPQATGVEPLALRRGCSGQHTEQVEALQRAAQERSSRAAEAAAVEEADRRLERARREVDSALSAAVRALEKAARAAAAALPAVEAAVEAMRPLVEEGKRVGSEDRFAANDAVFAVHDARFAANDARFDAEGPLHDATTEATIFEQARDRFDGALSGLRSTGGTPAETDSAATRTGDLQDRMAAASSDVEHVRTMLEALTTQADALREEAEAAAWG